ncbi:GUN4 domain-containing protein [Nostoc sp.]|uniref:GUN4 domain-containing protein n=1 Tax=Nostoc sp. TaxID=1180 RepID=UPI002FF8AC8C
MADQPSARKLGTSDLELDSQYRNGKRWAVIVGISKYQYSDINLKYADRDAEELYQLLLTPNGGSFQADHICKLTNEQATTGNINRALRSFLKKPAREDLVLIYFACHGSPDPDRPSNVYFLTYDTDPKDIAGTALPMKEIDRTLQESLLSHKVIILADACHSAAIGGGIGQPIGQPRSVIDNSQKMNRFLQAISRAKGGVALLTSAEANEVSFEDTKWGGGHGVFTHFLLEGMRGAADLDGNGIVTIGELFDYVIENVQRATDNNQHPSRGTNAYDRNMPIAITANTNFSPSSEAYQQKYQTPSRSSSRVEQTVEENLDVTLELALTAKEMTNGVEKPVFTGKENITVKIPAGVSSGKRIRVTGKGSFDSLRQKRGDLYLVVKLLNTFLTEDELRSACGINYNILRDFLITQKWQKADEETESILQLLSSRVEINDLPCEDLWTIDQLWVKYSDQRFGFSVQRRIWQSVAGEMSEDSWKSFCQKIGWFSQANQTSRELTIVEIRSKADGRSINSLVNGYLPSFILCIAKGNELIAKRFFDRVQKCRL